MSHRGGGHTHTHTHTHYRGSRPRGGHTGGASGGPRSASRVIGSLRQTFSSTHGLGPWAAGRGTGFESGGLPSLHMVNVDWAPVGALVLPSGRQLLGQSTPHPAFWSSAAPSPPLTPIFSTGMPGAGVQGEVGRTRIAMCVLVLGDEGTRARSRGPVGGICAYGDQGRTQDPWFAVVVGK